MITVKDFAREQGCGESIVYRHIRNHKEELGDRIQKMHGRTWLTDEGVSYIKNLMTQHMAIEEKAAPEVASLQKQLDEKNVTIKMLEAAGKALEERIKLREDAIEEHTNKIALLEADNEAQRVKIAEAEKNAQKLSDELSEARKKFEDEMHLLQNELQAEKNRKLTWKERLIGRKE